MINNNRNMKKTLILMAMALLLSLPLHSQVFLTEEEADNRDGQWSEIGLIVPIHQQDFDQAEYSPLGSGIALLAALGGAYLLGKKQKKN